jgi:hypoxanthine phosphoribosyltransferase
MTSEERSQSVKQRRVSWDEIGLYIPRLKKSIDEDGCRVFDAVVAIRRGGIVPGLALSHYYRLPLIIIDAFDFDPCDLPRRLLVVDDVIDTGMVYEEVFKKLFYTTPGNRLRYCLFAALFGKPWAPKYNIIIAEETADWIVMPWEQL